MKRFAINAAIIIALLVVLGATPATQPATNPAQPFADAFNTMPKELWPSDGEKVDVVKNRIQWMRDHKAQTFAATFTGTSFLADYYPIPGQKNGGTRVGIMCPEISVWGQSLPVRIVAITTQTFKPDDLNGKSVTISGTSTSCQIGRGMLMIFFERAKVSVK